MVHIIHRKRPATPMMGRAMAKNSFAAAAIKQSISDKNDVRTVSWMPTTATVTIAEHNGDVKKVGARSRELGDGVGVCRSKTMPHKIENWKVLFVFLLFGINGIWRKFLGDFFSPWFVRSFHSSVRVALTTRSMAASPCEEQSVVYIKNNVKLKGDKKKTCGNNDENNGNVWR